MVSLQLSPLFACGGTELERFSGLWKSGRAAEVAEMQTIRFGEGGPVCVIWSPSKAQIQAQDPEQSRYLNIGRKEARAGILMFWHGLRLFLYNKAKS